MEPALARTGPERQRQPRESGDSPSAGRHHSERDSSSMERDHLTDSERDRHPVGRDSSSMERDSPSVEQHHLQGTERDSPRRVSLSEERDSPSMERVHLTDNDRDSCSMERDIHRRGNERNTLSMDCNIDSLPMERHHPVKDSHERHLPDMDYTQDYGRDSLTLKRGGHQGALKPVTSTQDYERDNLSLVRDGYQGERQPVTSTQDYERDHHVRGGYQGALKPVTSTLDYQRDHQTRGGFQGERQPMPSTLDYQRDHQTRGGFQGERQPMPSTLDYQRDHHARGVYPGERQTAMGYDRLSVDRAHTMKEFEMQITELKKENFNLKLRIYFLEEQVQRRCDNSSEELHRMNIELKVEVESLKHEFQEKQNLLVRASKAMESLAAQHCSAIQQLREEHLKQLQDLKDPNNQKIHLLQEEVMHKKAELEKICALLDQERLQRFNAEERLLAVKEQYTKAMGILEERDWIIQCLNKTLHSKDALITQLEKQIATMMPCDTSIGLFPESDAREGHSETPDPAFRVDFTLKSSPDKGESIEWQRKIKEMDNLINELQQKLEANKAGSAIEEKNALKRDKAIQGLTLALKTKSKENDKLLNEMDNLNAALANARESAQEAQRQNLKENHDPEYKKLIFTLQAEQEIYSKLMKYERESGSLQKEQDAIAVLRKWLEENIQANQELRKIMEAQILAKCRESDTISFLGDQTSYLSICLDHLDQNDYRYWGDHGGKKTHQGDSNIVETGEAFRPVFLEDGETQTSQVYALTEGEHAKCLKCSFTKDQLDGKLELSVNGSDTHPAIQPRNEIIFHRQNTLSSSTQTELKCYADKSTIVDISILGKENEGVMEFNTDSDSEQHTLKASESNSDLQRGVQERYPVSQSTKKSRLPVLLRSSLNTKLKTDTPLTFYKEKYHHCLEEQLHMENCRLYEQLKCAEMEIESLKANEESVKRVDSTSDVDNSKERDSSEQTLQKELQLENYRISEQLQSAQMEIESLRANEGSVKRVDNSEQRDSSEESVQKELQLENYRLSEQLKSAQMEIELLRANEGSVKRVDNSEQRDSSEQTLQKELQLDNDRLSEQLKCAQREMKKLKADKVLIEDIDNCAKLDHSDAEDRYYPEGSFLDKTITNSINGNGIHDKKSDFEVEVCRLNIDGRNEAEIHCHHDDYCAECVNNRDTVALQISHTKRISTMYEQCTFPKVSSSGRSFEDATSLSKYDLLVQSQARELSLQRQKIKESHNLSIICSKNFFNILKAFNDLVPTSDLDSNIALRFQEQLTQTVEWLKELEYKLSDSFYGEEDTLSDHSVDSLLYTPSRLVPGHRMWADKRGCHVLGLVEDYNALRKQILEARNVLQETEAFIDHGVQTALLNMTEHFGNIFFEKLSRTKQSLEEANCLLKLLWRVSLPLQVHGSHIINQEEETNLEIARLRKRVVEQEKLLSGMVKRVYSENQMKEDIEKLILDQLAVTHDILKRAKGNLEVQVVDKHH